MDDLLFPPRELQPMPGDMPAIVVTQLDTTLPPQGFRIEASRDGAVLRHADDLGLRYATQAWECWLDAGGGSVVMEDHPDVLRRGYMLDVSRSRVPTRAYLTELVRLLARLRYNQLELYVEHTVAYEGHEAAWRDASPLDADDLRWLDDLCEASGIELVPNQNSLGHFDSWLVHPEYLDRAENPDGAVVGEEKLGPTTLAPTAANQAFVQDLIGQQTAMLRSRRVNVGLDEPWEFGTGVSRERCQREGEGVVYAKWAADVAQPWCDKGYRVEMWADIITQHPDQAALLPQCVEPVVWGYESPDRIRAVDPDAGEDAGFSASAAPLRERGWQVWTAPGTSTWNSLTGRLSNAVANIADAAEHAELGMLVTSWGDHGHWEPPALTWPGIVAGGLTGWNRSLAAGLADPEALTTAVSRALFGCPDHPGAALLVRLGLADDLTGVVVPNESIVWRALVRGGSLAGVQARNLTAFVAELEELDALAASLDEAPWVDDVHAIIALTLFTARTRSVGETPEVPSTVLAQLVRVRLLSSRPGGLPRAWAVLPTSAPCPDVTGATIGTEGAYAIGTVLNR